MRKSIGRCKAIEMRMGKSDKGKLEQSVEPNSHHLTRSSILLWA